MGNYREECVRLWFFKKGEISNWRLKGGDQHWDVVVDHPHLNCSVSYFGILKIVQVSISSVRCKR